MKKLLITMAVATALFTSCKKDDTTKPSKQITQHNVTFNFSGDVNSITAYKNSTQVSFNGNLSTQTGDVVRLVVTTFHHDNPYQGDVAYDEILVDGISVVNGQTHQATNSIGVINTIYYDADISYTIK